jgi:O-antigen ligase
MTLSATRLRAWVGGIALLFPFLLLCVPRGAGIFLGATVLGVAVAGRGLGPAWRLFWSELRPLIFAILAVLAVVLFSCWHFGLTWNWMDNPSRLLIAVLIGVLVVCARPDPGWLWRGINGALFSVLAIVAFQRWSLGDMRPSAWVQPIAFANMVAALGLIGFIRPGVTWRTHAAAWLTVGLASAVLALNGTRGGLLALLVPMPVLLFVRHPSLKGPKFVVAISGLVLVVAALYAVVDGKGGGRFAQVESEIQQFHKGSVDTSVGARLALWGIAIDTVLAKPWVGTGVGQFHTAVKTSRYCVNPADHPEVCRLGHAHDDMLEAAATMGLPGLIAVLAIFLVPGWLFAKFRRICRQAGNRLGERLAISGMAVVVASLISGLTQVTMAHQANAVFYAGITGLLLGLTVVQARFPHRGEAESM